MKKIPINNNLEQELAEFEQRAKHAKSLSELVKVETFVVTSKFSTQEQIKRMDEPLVVGTHNPRSIVGDIYTTKIGV